MRPCASAHTLRERFVLRGQIGLIAKRSPKPVIGAFCAGGASKGTCGGTRVRAEGLQVGTGELEEMGAKFCLGLLVLQLKSLPCRKEVMAQAASLLDLEEEIADLRTQRSESQLVPCFFCEVAPPSIFSG
ncbi:UNVERIFIED_CONTAM: hypothetical protein K2H54_031713 [Gekko kuhli]